MRAFFDTNILIYAHISDDPRAEPARSLLRGGGVISVQSLNEFVNVARRKLRWDWFAIDDALADLHEVFDPIVVIDQALHRRGIAIARHYGVSIYDSMILAAAITAGCERIYSEDMQDHLVVDGSVVIVNPFRDL